MKTNHALISILSVSLLAAGCGEYSKNPVQDLAAMRENARLELKKGPDSVREITKEVIVKEDRIVKIEESTINGSLLVISADEDMDFEEGKTKQYKIQARVLDPSVEIKLNVEEKPKEVSIEKSTKEANVYILTYTPALYTVPANKKKQKLKVVLKAVVTSTKNAADAAKYEGLVRTKELDLTVFRTEDAPSEVQVLGLGTQVSEGTITTFSVTAKVPGTDANAPQKPSLIVTADENQSTAGQNFKDLDGSRHIPADTKVEYIKDSVWKFTKTFDTQNIPVQPQIGKTGAILQNVDGTFVRVAFRVAYDGLQTAPTVQRIKIAYTKPISAPRFDLTSIGQTGLKASPGKTVVANFTVTSADAQAEVKVETPVTSLDVNPSLTCVDASTGANKQNCTLSLNVSCDTKLENLNGDITVNALSVVNGRNSNLVAAKIKVVATQDATLCSAEAAK
ncbi:hypothetical protein ACES2L_06860 [Bdellovibrio bacteriovorus]